MIIGHIGVAFAARRRWPAISMGALLLATFAPDLLRVILERVPAQPRDGNFYAHALPWSVLLALAVGAASWTWRRSRETAAVMASLVMLHVVFDMVSGRKPLWGGGPMGLDVQRLAPAGLLLESVIALAGWLYLRRGLDRARWYAAPWVPAVMILLAAMNFAGGISQRGWVARCIAHPIVACDDSSWLTTKWRVAPFWGPE